MSFEKWQYLKVCVEQIWAKLQMDIMSKPPWSKKLKFPKISHLIDISKW